MRLMCHSYMCMWEIIVCGGDGFVLPFQIIVKSDGLWKPVKWVVLPKMEIVSFNHSRSKPVWNKSSKHESELGKDVKLQL